jgi:hypothetical protein
MILCNPPVPMLPDVQLQCSIHCNTQSAVILCRVTNYTRQVVISLRIVGVDTIVNCRVSGDGCDACCCSSKFLFYMHIVN